MNKPTFKVSVVVPCYNEHDNIPLIFTHFNKVIEANPELQVVLVDNGSTDNSLVQMQNQLNSCQTELRDNYKIIRLDVNQGYGYGILYGLKHADADILSWTHADMQTDPMDVHQAYLAFIDSDQNTIIKGKRKNRQFVEAFFTWGMQLFAQLALNTQLDDINAQPKMFSREFYEHYIDDKAPHDFSLDLYLLYIARQQAYKVKTIPVFFAERLHGEAKGGGSWKTKFSLIKRTILYILALKKTLTHTGK